MSPLARQAAFRSLRASLRQIEDLRTAAEEVRMGGVWLTSLAVLRLKEAAR
jgi:hypothetical protein